jgi:hypothetical protein
VHQAGDDRIDSYRAMNGEMAVFGYGRDNLTRHLDRVPDTFTLGLMDTTAADLSADIINGIYQPISGTQLGSEKRNKQLVENANPFQIKVQSDMAISALFAQEQYTLKVITVGQGSVTVAPQRASYAYGEVVHLTATPAPYWTLASWSGDSSGSYLEVDLTISGDASVTATFVSQPEVGLTIEVVGKGVVTRSPESELAYGDIVTIWAAADPCWQFTGWSGDLTGSQNPATLLINGGKKVTATFTQSACRLYLPLITKENP